jgi:hypothetical protein
MALEIDWGDISEGRWRELAQACEANELELRFCVARHNGASATAAARAAGVVGRDNAIRQRALKLKNSEPVIALLAAAAAETGGPTGGITEREIEATIARLIRARDVSANKVGVELYDKREQRKREFGNGPDDDGFVEWRLAREMCGVPFGAVCFLGMTCGNGAFSAPAISCIPMFHDVYWRAMRDAPEYVETLRSRLSATMLEDLANRVADFDWQRQARTQIWEEVGVSIDQANAAIAEAKSAIKQGETTKCS